MKALLLAAGLGTRLRPITNNIPKCLVPIHNKPLLQYWLEMLIPEIDQILINTHYLAEPVENFVRQSKWANYVTLVNETYLLGTGGTVLKNRKFLEDGPFLLAHADNLTKFNLHAFINAHLNRPAHVDITMMTFDTDNPQSCGIIEQDKNNIVMAFHEKSKEYKGNRANAAVYIMEPTVIDYLASFGKEIIDISTEVLPNYLGRMQTYHNSDYHRDIGTTESLHLAEKEFYQTISV